MTDDERAVYDAFRAHKRVFTGHALDALAQVDCDDVAVLLTRAHARWRPRPTLSVRHGPRKGAEQGRGGAENKPVGQD